MDEIVAAECNITRPQLVEHWVNHFILSPALYDPIDVQLLREPVSEIVTLPIRAASKEYLHEFAHANKISISALMRNIIYAGLMRYDLRPKSQSQST